MHLYTLFYTGPFILIQRCNAVIFSALANTVQMIISTYINMSLKPIQVHNKRTKTLYKKRPEAKISSYLIIGFEEPHADGYSCSVHICS
jgi:hypothetical protein